MVERSGYRKMNFDSQQYKPSVSVSGLLNQNRISGTILQPELVSYADGDEEG